VFETVGLVEQENWVDWLAAGFEEVLVAFY
jgi:hypothetical protein